MLTVSAGTGARLFAPLAAFAGRAVVGIPAIAVDGAAGFAAPLGLPQPALTPSNAAADTATR